MGRFYLIIIFIVNIFFLLISSTTGIFNWLCDYRRNIFFNEFFEVMAHASGNYFELCTLFNIIV